jgi:hypothetical protein
VGSFLPHGAAGAVVVAALVLVVLVAVAVFAGAMIGWRERRPQP